MFLFMHFPVDGWKNLLLLWTIKNFICNEPHKLSTKNLNVTKNAKN